MVNRSRLVAFVGLGFLIPTIEIVTNDGFCVGAKMNKVGKDDGRQYQAQKK